jgi:hypothetical protein
VPVDGRIQFYFNHFRTRRDLADNGFILPPEPNPALDLWNFTEIFQTPALYVLPTDFFYAKNVCFVHTLHSAENALADISNVRNAYLCRYRIDNDNVVTEVPDEDYFYPDNTRDFSSEPSLTHHLISDISRIQIASFKVMNRYIKFKFEKKQLSEPVGLSHAFVPYLRRVYDSDREFDELTRRVTSTPPSSFRDVDDVITIRTPFSDVTFHFETKTELYFYSTLFGRLPPLRAITPMGRWLEHNSVYLKYVIGIHINYHELGSTIFFTFK